MQTLIIYHLVLTIAFCQTYNHNSNSGLLNQTWMTNFDDGIPLIQLNLIGTHSTMSQGIWGDAVQTQSLSLTTQLNAGIRLFELRCNHYYNTFPIHQGIIYLNVYLNQVLDSMASWLASYPGQALVVRICEQSIAWGNTQTFEQTFQAYLANYTSLIWTPTSQNPLLSDIRGKVVILQAFTANGVYGLLESKFTVQPHTSFTTNWDLYSKWSAVKSALTAANSGRPYVSFWTGNGGSMPYFVASGKSSHGNNDPCLATGLTTPGFSSSYPDFPRVVCVSIFGVNFCTICFGSINQLASNYISSQGYNHVGWLFTDFAGDSLIQQITALNLQNFASCPAALKTSGCTSCDTKGSCLSCNTRNNYVYSSGSCVAAPGYYLNNSIPVNCTLNIFGCIGCTSSSVCQTCNTTQNYSLNAQTSVCEAAAGFYIDSSSNLSIACNITLTGCVACTDNATCTACNSNLNFILNQTSCVCDPSQNYILVANGVCICDAGYYLLNSVCNLYSACPTVSALVCSSCAETGFCDTCNTSLNYVIDSTQQCACADGYYFDGTNCVTCNTSLTGCNQCASSSICINCTSTFKLMLPNCVCPAATFLNGTICSNCQVGCLSCTSLTLCLVCDVNNNLQLLANNTCDCIAGYFLNSTTAVCETCSTMPGCLTCNTNGCTSCDTTLNYTLINGTCDCPVGFYGNTSNGLCTACSMVGCTACSSATVCTACTPTVFIYDGINNVCNQVCGDGVLYILACDDGNIINGDGCSSVCAIETNYSCIGGDTYVKSVCSYNQPLQISYVNAVKDPYSNQITITMTILPPISNLNGLDYNNLISTSITVDSSNFTYDGNGNLTAIMLYSTPLHQSSVNVTFTPPTQPEFYYTPAVTKLILVASSNNQALFVYPSNLYSIQKLLDTIVPIVGYTFLGITFIGMFVGRLIPVEMMGVAQVAYMGMLYVDYLQPLMVPFSKLTNVNGINTYFTKTTQILPYRISATGYSKVYLININYMLIVVVVILIAYVVLAMLARTDEKYLKWMKKTSGEILFAILMIFCYHNVTSLTIALKYGSLSGIFNIIGVAVGGCMLIGLIMQSVRYYAETAEMGEFKSFFHEESRFSRQAYYLLVVFNRILLAVLICFLNQNEYIGYIAPAIPMIELVTLGMIRPYRQTHHNRRAAFNLLVTLTILSIYSYYRLSMDIDNQISQISIYLPLAIIGLLVLVLIVNVYYLIKEVLPKKQNLEQKYKSNQIEMTNMMEKEVKAKALETSFMQLPTHKSQYNMAKKKSSRLMTNKNSMLSVLNDGNESAERSSRRNLDRSLLDFEHKA